VRICDGQTEMSHALAVMALALACIARFCDAYDRGEALPAHANRLLEENLWRAIRSGLEGEMIDLDRGVVRPTIAAIDGLLGWVEPVVDRLGLAPFLAGVERMLATGNGAMFQLRRLAELGDVRAVHAEVVTRTRESAEELLAAFPATEVSA
jgi:carboxylate-amine ligase